MAMKVSKVKKKPGLNYEERKESEKAMKDSFNTEEKKPEESSVWQGIIDKVMGKSFSETMADNQKKNLKKMKKK